MDAKNVLFNALLNRRNITWELDERETANYKTAIEEALSLLRKVAAGTDVDFTQGDNRELCVTCASYLLEQMRAEFMRDYAGELNMLRITEGFGCGAEGTV